MSTRETWTNWTRAVDAHPERIEHPTSTADVVSLVQLARSQGLPVKAYGAGHSFTPIAVTDGFLLRLDRMNHLLAHDATSGRVRVQAGMSLRELNPRLRELGLAMPNLGDVDPQSVAGATSTGTHGTGGKLQGIAATVVGVQLVTAEGDVVEVGEQHPWFGAARVSLGALGIITEVTLQCVPAFLLHAREEPMALAEVIERLPELVEDNDHFEFYWFPHTQKALVKRNNRVGDDTSPAPVGRVRHLLEDELLSNGAFELFNRVGSVRRSLVPRINHMTGSVLSAREFVDHSYKVFVSARRVRFHESEFAVPRAALPDVIAGLQSWFDAGHETISFPIEVRFTEADNVWMSTAHERDNCYVAVHQYHRNDPTAYFAAAQDIFIAHEGRPHWGKMNTVDADYLRERYARFDDFVAVRDEADPDRTFTNPYLDRVLG